jgi:hypothetical protein
MSESSPSPCIKETAGPSTVPFHYYLIDLRFPEALMFRSEDATLISSEEGAWVITMALQPGGISGLENLASAPVA